MLLDTTSYRPVSLLNVDFKLLSKLLALRLESFLPSIISLDQTGLIRNRHWRNSLLSCYIQPHKLQSQSGYFHLYRSTRQRCPLSPILFTIATEPLSIALRSNPHIAAILRNDTQLKVSLYADDLLLYVSNLSVSVPTTLATLQSFGQIPGYKLNLNKSEIFPINPAAKMYPKKNVSFKF